MMAFSWGWRVVHYETRSGRCPIREFIDKLNRKERAKVLARIDLLEEEGPKLRRPYAGYLRDDIYELRVRISRIQYRVLYFFWSGTDIVLTHGIKKKVKRVPENEIDRAVRYREDWLMRDREAS